ncbi:FlgO family outer membrane protein, partial [Acinetobacter venetianus]
MYKALCILPLLLLPACSMTSPQQQAEVKSQAAPVNLLAQQLVDELVTHNDALKPTQPLLVMTPVMVEDMQSSNALASQLQQGLMTAFHQRGFNLVDLNLADAVRVTPQGDFILTRDW